MERQIVTAVITAVTEFCEQNSEYLPSVTIFFLFIFFIYRCLVNRNCSMGIRKKNTRVDDKLWTLTIYNRRNIRHT